MIRSHLTGNLFMLVNTSIVAFVWPVSKIHAKIATLCKNLDWDKS
jgi:hypothetical protein